MSFLKGEILFNSSQRQSFITLTGCINNSKKVLSPTLLFGNNLCARTALISSLSTVTFLIKKIQLNLIHLPYIA